MTSVFWADTLAEDIVNRNKFNHIEKAMPPVETYFIKSSTSISGVPHIGNASDVIRHDALARGLRGLGKDAVLYWVAENMDAFRKVPAGIPKEYEKYLGMPVADIPCPDGCCASYSEHFCRLFADSLEKSFGVKLVLKSTDKSYRSGEFSPYIKKAMESLELIKSIWNKSMENPLPENWTPWKPVCEKCGKIMTTVVKDSDEKGANYVCENYDFKKYGKEAYTSVPGCGHEGRSLYSKGNGKLLWRVEWGMLWASWKIVFEGAGKEHFMPTGSFWTAGEICERVFGWPEPYPAENPLQPYEYLTIDGQKMSASVGNVVSTWDWPTFAPPQVLRLLFLKKPRKVRDFSYQKMPDYVDEYDKIQRIYFGAEKEDNEREEEHLKRMYEMVEVGALPEKLPVQIPFSFASMISQISKPNESMGRALELLGGTGHVKGNISREDEEGIRNRLLLAREWVRRYAPENMIIKLRERVPDDLGIPADHREALLGLKEELKMEWNAEDLQNRIYEIGKGLGDVKGFFQSLYAVLIGKSSGPKAGYFIIAIGKDKARKILEQL